MSKLPYGAIRVLDVEPENPRVLVRLELTYAELAELQQAVYTGASRFPVTLESRRATDVSDDLLRICRDLALEDREAYKALTQPSEYVQGTLW